MQITMAVLADAANICQDGKLNILGIFRDLQGTAVPARHPQMVLVVRILADPGEKGMSYSLLVRILDDDGSVVQEFPSFGFTVPPVSTPFNHELTLIVTIRDMVLPKFGNYSIKLLIDNQHKGDIPFALCPIEQPSLPLPDAPADE